MRSVLSNSSFEAFTTTIPVAASRIGTAVSASRERTATVAPFWTSNSPVDVLTSSTPTPRAIGVRPVASRDDGRAGRRESDSWMSATMAEIALPFVTAKKVGVAVPVSKTTAPLNKPEHVPSTVPPTVTVAFTVPFLESLPVLITSMVKLALVGSILPPPLRSTEPKTASVPSAAPLAQYIICALVCTRILHKKSEAFPKWNVRLPLFLPKLRVVNTTPKSLADPRGDGDSSSTVALPNTPLWFAVAVSTIAGGVSSVGAGMTTFEAKAMPLAAPSRRIHVPDLRVRTAVPCTAMSKHL
mmetsp:Transcript_19276/g.50089  ORF Transcript_19276/g.50089 Transcript_19276/m.50089 type:complete len:299 (+) Transcript_19276:2682-3578(+)